MATDPPTSALSDPVRSLAAFDVTVATAGATLRQVATLMDDAGCGLLVVDTGEQIGVVSERDVVRGLAAGADADQAWAIEVMSADPLEVDADASIEDAAIVMIESGVRHLLVRDGDRLGVVSMRDLLEPLLDATD